jgi:hypothetical protein
VFALVKPVSKYSQKENMNNKDVAMQHLWNGILVWSSLVNGDGM